MLLAALLTTARKRKRPAYYANSIESEEAADHLGFTIGPPEIPIP